MANGQATPPRDAVSATARSVYWHWERTLRAAHLPPVEEQAHSALFPVALCAPRAHRNRRVFAPPGSRAAGGCGSTGCGVRDKPEVRPIRGATSAPRGASRPS